MHINNKTRENRLRRQLSRLGYTLHKSRIRNTNLDNFGGYMIVDSYYNAIVAGERFDLDIDDVENFVA